MPNRNPVAPRIATRIIKSIIITMTNQLFNRLALVHYNKVFTFSINIAKRARQYKSRLGGLGDSKVTQ
jgi:hypothetical protein